MATSIISDPNHTTAKSPTQDMEPMLTVISTSSKEATRDYPIRPAEEVPQETRMTIALMRHSDGKFLRFCTGRRGFCTERLGSSFRMSFLFSPPELQTQLPDQILNPFSPISESLSHEHRLPAFVCLELNDPEEPRLLIA